MSRFVNMLYLVLPEIQVRTRIVSQSYEGYQRSFANWKKARKARGDPETSIVDRWGGRSDLAVLWYVEDVFLLRFDQFLSLPRWSYHTPYAFHTHEASEEGLQERLRDLQAIGELLLAHLWALREAYESTQMPDFFETHPPRSLRMYINKELWESYDATRRFFGKAFHPLMEAYKLHEDGAPESPLYHFMEAGGTCPIATSEVNRLVTKHLGLPRYHVLAGKRWKTGREERCEVNLATYTKQDQQRVVSFLMAQRRSRMDVQWLLCELALRKIIPAGTYLIQPDE